MSILIDFFLMLGTNMFCNFPAVLLICLSKCHVASGQARNLLLVQCIGAEDACDGARAKCRSRQIKLPTVLHFFLRGIRRLCRAHLNKLLCLDTRLTRFDGSQRHSHGSANCQDCPAILFQEPGRGFHEVHRLLPSNIKDKEPQISPRLRAQIIYQFSPASHLQMPS